MKKKFNDTMQFITLSVLLFAIIAVTPAVHGQSDPENDKDHPSLIVRFIAVALPPRVIMSDSDESTSGELIDEAAIPPSDLVLQKGKSSQPVTMMLNVPSRNFLLKNRQLVITRGNTDSKKTAFINLELPSDQGVFTVVFTRRPGQSSWDDPTISILADAVSAKTTGTTRIVNLTPNDIRIQAGESQNMIAPGKQFSFDPAEKSWLNAAIYAQQKQDWIKLGSVSGTQRQGLVHTIICYPKHPKETSVSILTCDQRNQDISLLEQAILEMDKTR